MMYEVGLVVYSAVTTLGVVFCAGYALRWKKRSHFWKDRYLERINHLPKAPLPTDPYEKVMEELGYDWEEGWD